MVAKAENGHVNIQELFKFNFIATYNIRSPEKDYEKNMVLYKKGDDITPFDGLLEATFTSKMKSHKKVTKQQESRFFLLFLLDDRRIRIRNTDAKNLLITTQNGVFAL